MSTFNPLQQKALELNSELKGQSVEVVLKRLLEEFDHRIALSSSLSIEDQLLTDALVKINPQVRIFTLDTGRLFPETYDLIEKTNTKYGIKLDVYFPDYHEVQQLIKTDGINLFYKGIEQRKACCQIRKLNPLRRAFEGLDGWICGLRKEQSVTRNQIELIEWDANNQLIKVNPLIDYTEEAVWEYIRTHQVPFNKLQLQGFPSIGCQPCTRAVQPGEDIRSGRWWWENPEHKECGLHRPGTL